MWRVDSLEKTLMLGKVEGRRRRGWQRMRWLDDITDLMDVSSSKLWECDGQGSLVCCSPWGCKESDATEWLNWIEVGLFIIFADCWSVVHHHLISLLMFLVDVNCYLYHLLIFHLSVIHLDITLFFFCFMWFILVYSCTSTNLKNYSSFGIYFSVC